jgi:ABC-type transport system involved in multi-copper enzyme maturation permease subunit
MQHIIKLTLKEILNKRILHVGIILTIVYLLIYCLGLRSIIKSAQGPFVEQAGYQLMTLGWYMSTFLAGTLAIMAGIGSLSGEIESGTMLSLVSKPLSRRAIVMGKFSAYTLVTGVYSALMVGAILMIAGHYLKLVMNPGAMITGILLFMLFPVILLAVAHLGSALMSTLAAGISTFMLFTVGIIGGFIEQIGAVMGNHAMVNIGVISSLLIPCDAVYRMAVAQTGGMSGNSLIADIGPFGAASTPSIWMLVYALIYIMVMLILAIYFFEKRDL